MKAYLEKVKHSALGFNSIQIIHVPIEKNDHANALVTQATTPKIEASRIVKVQTIK